MAKNIAIILVIVIVVGGVSYFLYNKNVDEKWNDKCRASGGKVIESGKKCDYLDCDRSKYSCSMYS